MVGVYGGYFGAGAGVMLLALLLHATAEQLPRANAVKNIVLGVANAVASVAFVVFGRAVVDVAPPRRRAVHRRASWAGHRPPPCRERLRAAIAVAGLGLAVKLLLGAYG